MTASTSVAPLTLPTPDLSDESLAEVTAEVAATAAEYDRSAAIPTRGIEVAHRAGLLTATVAERDGGPGASPLDVARILVALGEGDPSVALLAANTLAIHGAHWCTLLVSESDR